MISSMILRTNFSTVLFTLITCLLSSITTTNAMRRRGHQTQYEPSCLITNRSLIANAGLISDDDSHNDPQIYSRKNYGFIAYRDGNCFYLKIKTDIVRLENFRSLIEFITENPGITHLDASQTCITDDQLSDILDLCNDTLIDLNLDSCFNIRTPVIKCSKLLKLSLRKCFQITDQHLAVILTQCKNTLQVLDLSYCIGLVNAIIACPNLKLLNLTYCANLVEPTIICPVLKI